MSKTQDSNSREPITAASLRLVTADGQPVPRPPPPVQPRRVGRDDLYYPGVNCNRLEAVARLPGKALPVYMAIWFEVKTKRKRTIDLTNQRLHLMGVLADAKREALQALEGAGLISVEYRPRGSPVVTLLDHPGAELPA